jgi:hypothetical protein
MPPPTKEQILAELKRRGIDPATAGKQSPAASTKSTVSTSGTAKKSSAFEGNPEYEAERKRIASTNPDNTVTPEQYKELSELYEQAKASGKGDAVLKFQQRYHEIIPDAALQIIANDPKRTKLAQQKGYTGYDLRGNEDAYFGNRTEQYMQKLKALEPKAAEPAADPAKPTAPVQKTPAGPVSNFEQEDIYPNYGYEPGQFWTQDIINTLGSAQELWGLKKHNPWNPTFHPDTPNPTFYDPTRELAANAEQLKIGMDAAGMYGDPNTMASTFSSMQGKAAENAANVLGRYNNQNVGVANQHEMQRSSINNEARNINNQSKKRQYDEQTVANQQFDNAKREARRNLRDSFVNAWTNRGQTQALNSMFPQYHTDPVTGYVLTTGKGKDFYKSNPQQSFADYVRYFKGEGYNMQDGDAIKAAQMASGMKGFNPYDDPNREAYMRAYGYTPHD